MTLELLLDRTERLAFHCLSSSSQCYLFLEALILNGGSEGEQFSWFKKKKQKHPNPNMRIGRRILLSLCFLSSSVLVNWLSRGRKTSPDNVGNEGKRKKLNFPATYRP